MTRPNDLVEACARVAHEANRAYCLMIGDDSQPSWDDAPDWQKSSARNGVAGALNGATPQESHASWLAEKVTTGWKYGPIKNPEIKEHPCMVPYAELPPAQRVKDAIFIGVVIAFGAAVDSSSPEIVRAATADAASAAFSPPGIAQPDDE